MTSKRKLEKNGEDEPPLKIQKTGDNDTHESCKDELNENTSLNLTTLNSDDTILIDYSTNIFNVCKNGNLDLIKVLVERGISLQERNEFGETCLMIACENGHFEIVKYLVEHGCNINEKSDDGDTSLIVASHHGHLEIVKYLVENGCNINDKDADGDTSLITASQEGHLNIIKYFVNEKGCSLQEMDSFGTCIMNAAMNNHFECVLWMLSNGSSLDENIKLDENGNIIECESCADILKEKGKFDELKRIYETKSSKK